MGGNGNKAAETRRSLFMDLYSAWLTTVNRFSVKTPQSHTGYLFSSSYKIGMLLLLHQRQVVYLA